MATTMSLIAKQTVGSGGASSVTFSNIPQTFTDLKVIASIRGAGAQVSEAINVYPNGSSANGTRIALYGTGSAAGSENYANIRWDYFSAANATANTFGSGEMYIPNYTSSNYKSFSMEGVAEGNSSSGVYMAMTASLWSNTAAITSLQFTGINGSLAEFTTFYLYGISNSSTQATTVPYASGGDVITTDGTYWYHAFKYSGTFTPLKALTCDYLVVAGGAGGGAQHGGGGGAGGLRSTVTATGGGGTLETALSLTANTAYTATVGAGGAGTASISVRGTNGSNSVFSTITSTGGGGGGSRLTELTGANGGSGGGAGFGSTGGSGTVNQGYAGGNDSGAGAGGGGGGAGAIGANSGGGVTGGNGGNGIAISALATATSTGVSNYYAGGGGGGAQSGQTVGSGGAGGGGSGTNTTSSGAAGTVNTGSGGGGGGYSGGPGYGGAGGSGIIIIRYAV